MSLKTAPKTIDLTEDEVNLILGWAGTTNAEWGDFQKDEEELHAKLWRFTYELEQERHSLINVRNADSKEDI